MNQLTLILAAFGGVTGLILILIARHKAKVAAEAQIAEHYRLATEREAQPKIDADVKQSIRDTETFEQAMEAYNAKWKKDAARRANPPSGGPGSQG